VLRLIYAFVEIALHRRGPDHLPASRFFFSLVLVVYTAVSVFSIQFADDLAHPYALIVVQGALSIAFTWCLLRAFERQHRFFQTASALLGTNAFLDLVSVWLVVWHRGLNVAPTELTLPLTLYLLVAVVWNTDVSAFVVARALDRPYFLGVSIVIGYLLLSYSLLVTLFPRAS